MLFEDVHDAFTALEALMDERHDGSDLFFERLVEQCDVLTGPVIGDAVERFDGPLERRTHTERVERALDVEGSSVGSFYPGASHRSVFDVLGHWPEMALCLNEFFGGNRRWPSNDDPIRLRGPPFTRSGLRSDRRRR
jgi:hypothetical protein